MSTNNKEYKEETIFANEFLDFVNQAVSPWHAVAEVKHRLEEGGFQHLSERDNWKLEKGGKYYFTRNHSSVVAFTVGEQFQPGNGFKIVGAHTDSPDLKLKPVSNAGKVGFIQVGVQTYGGGLWHTWFDRDLTVAGRVLVSGEDNKVQHRLVKINRPILRIPSLAIHLDRSVKEGFKFNDENQLLPVLATIIKSQLDNEKEAENARHHPLLVKILAEALNVEATQIIDFELSVVDTQPAVLAGINNEFLFSPRLDNLLSSYCGLRALIDASTKEALSQDSDVRVVALYDHEEIGSESFQGAGSRLTREMIERITSCVATNENSEAKDNVAKCLVQSFIVSADMAHAVHPNYSEKHQEKHRPMMHKGVVVKVNANQRYATNLVTGYIMQEIAKRAQVPLQDFVVRNDVMCGSTIGPILSANCGVRCVDIGVPQLSMHSIREMCGTTDVLYCYKLLKEYYNSFRQVDNSLSVDSL